MATMLDGESYVGRVLVRQVSPTGDVKLYCWPLRCLKGKIGGTTFGLDVKGEEILRFDPHGRGGHWHKNGYDKLGAGGSHVAFPDGLTDSEAQFIWSLEQLRTHAEDLLAEAGHPDAAAALDPTMLATAVDAVRSHVEQEGDLRTEAIAKGLLAG